MITSHIQETTNKQTNKTQTPEEQTMQDSIVRDPFLMDSSRGQWGNLSYILICPWLRHSFRYAAAYMCMACLYHMHAHTHTLTVHIFIYTHTHLTGLGITSAKSIFPLLKHRLAEVWNMSERVNEQVNPYLTENLCKFYSEL